MADMTAEKLKVKEAAALAGVTERTVRDWIKRGWIAALKLGNSNRIRILKEDLDAFLVEAPASVQLIPSGNQDVAAWLRDGAKAIK